MLSIVLETIAVLAAFIVTNFLVDETHLDMPMKSKQPMQLTLKQSLVSFLSYFLFVFEFTQTIT